MMLKRIRATIASLLVAAGTFAAVGVFLSASFPFAPVSAHETNASELAARFDYLSKNGNSNCSGAFLRSIASMPEGARLQGSCCSPMSLHRYGEQVAGLQKFKEIVVIPPDPYDVEAGLAKKLLAHYSLELTPEEQKAYDYATENADEKGPCCCRCWRWTVYGGLAKYLIRSHGFTGAQVAQVWDLSDGCGGDADHLHQDHHMD